MHPDLNSGSESSAVEAQQSEEQAGAKRESGVINCSHVPSSKEPPVYDGLIEHMRKMYGTDASGGTELRSGGALRFNAGKTAFSALPLDLCAGAARVMAKGRKKYAKGNYRKGYEDVESPLDSLIRHVGAVQRAVEAEDKDGSKGFMFDESGEAHIHHVVTSALLVIQTMQLMGWDVEKSYSKMLKTKDNTTVPAPVNADTLAAQGHGTLFIDGVKQETKDSSK